MEIVDDAGAQHHPPDTEGIRASKLSQAALARLCNVSRQTIRKWQERESPVDGSHRPFRLKTTLTPAQELIVVELRTTLLLPTDHRFSVLEN